VDAERRREGADNLFAGEWTQDLSKTRLRQGLRSRSRRTETTGSVFGRLQLHARFDGKEYDLKNSSNDTVTLNLSMLTRWIRFTGETIKVTQKDRWVVSADGQQMTLTTTGTLETGQQVKESWYFGSSNG
jgi:hypothetical protein